MSRKSQGSIRTGKRGATILGRNERDGGERKGTHLFYNIVLVTQRKNMVVKELAERRMQTATRRKATAARWFENEWNGGRPGQRGGGRKDESIATQSRANDLVGGSTWTADRD